MQPDTFSNQTFHVEQTKRMNLDIDFGAVKEVMSGLGNNLDTYLDAQAMNAANAAKYNAAQISIMQQEQENKNKITDLLGKAVLVVVATVALIALVRAWKM